MSSTLEGGNVIESYPDGKPYPSYLMLVWCKERWVHVVTAEKVRVDEVSDL